MIQERASGIFQRLCQKVMQLQHLDSARAFVIKRQIFLVSLQKYLKVPCRWAVV